MSRRSVPVAVMNWILVTLLAIGMLAVAFVLWQESALAIGFAASVVAGLRIASAAEIRELTAAAAGCGILLVLAELWPRRHATHFVSRIDGGTIEYSAALVAELIESDLAGLDGVQSAQVSISGERQQLNITALVAAEAGIEPQLIAARALGRARDRVSGLGLPLGRLHISLEPAKLSAAPSARPTQSVA